MKPSAARLETLEIIDELLDLIHVAVDIAETPNIDWDTKYDLIFSKRCSEAIYELRSELGIKFEHYDPDASPEEDVRAYIRALGGMREVLRKLRVSLSAGLEKENPERNHE